MVNCPFGAIADKSQIFQLIRCMKNGGEVIAEIAPAYVGQFGAEATPEKIHAALRELGFSKVYEVALGADIGAVTEAHDYVYHVKTGKIPFLLTSCCPSWAMLAKKQFPEIIDSVSKELTPMVATARSIKKGASQCQVGIYRSLRGEEAGGDAQDGSFGCGFCDHLVRSWTPCSRPGELIRPGSIMEKYLHDATAAGRGYGVAGGVQTPL